MFKLALCAIGLTAGLCGDRKPREPVAEPTAFTSESRQFLIPLLIDPNRRCEIRGIHLFVSKDRGANWEETAVATPDAKYFRYSVDADGVYWFAVMTVFKDGKTEPAVGQKPTPSLAVRVDTQQPEQLTVPPTPADAVPTPATPPPPPPVQPQPLLPPPPPPTPAEPPLNRDFGELRERLLKLDQQATEMEIARLRGAVQRLESAMPKMKPWEAKREIFRLQERLNELEWGPHPVAPPPPMWRQMVPPPGSPVPVQPPFPPPPVPNAT